MPVVRLRDLNASNTNDPSVAVVDTQIDLALLLSEHYGRNIRQGNSFKVNGIQAWIKPATQDALAGVDTGISAAVKLSYIPTTGHSRRAWNNVFKQWKAQKNLAGAVGTQIRYDDMEFGWSDSHDTARTSTIFGTGIGDSNTEKLVLTGSSTGGTDFSLEDYYNSTYTSPLASKNHFDNTVIKEPKFGADPFPQAQALFTSAANSANSNAATSLDNDSDVDWNMYGALADSEMTILPTPVHVLCGVMRAQAWIMPDDTVDQIEEDMSLDISISVVSWKPLVYRPRRKAGRKTSKRSGGGRSGTKSTSKNARS